VQLLLTKKAGVNSRDNDGQTALMLASRDGYREVVQMLLAKKAAVNEKDKNGVTALMLASKGSHREVKKLLQKAGAK
jgi:ankyrin repeat protein